MVLIPSWIFMVIGINALMALNRQNVHLAELRLAQNWPFIINSQITAEIFHIPRSKAVGTRGY